MSTDRTPLPPLPPLPHQPGARPPDPRTMVAHSPEDLLAAVPVVLGFHPQDSLVMVTAGSRGRPFHARVDLPTPDPGGGVSRDAVAGSVEPLRQAARAHRVDRLAFVLYTPHRALALAVAAALEVAFADVGLVGILRADAGRWRALAAGREGPSQAYDVRLHAFAVEAVVDGTVVHRDRAALAASIARDPTGSAAVAAAVVGLPVIGPGDPAGAEVAGADVAGADVAWATDLVDAARAGDRLTDHEVARLVRLLGHVGTRDEVWLRLTRARARDLVPWWSDVVRRTPDRLVADPACLLAFTAWLAGQGALAWCAVDRCRAVDPQHTGAALVAAVLDGAVPPTDWGEVGDH